MGEGRSRLDVVIVGHVDHGKSTVVGRILADTGSLPRGKLEAVRSYCARHSKPFEYAFLLDALKDEQSQGITIDVARVFFRTKRREYLILDAPGHVEFIKSMVSGAAHASAALIVTDVLEGIQENSRRHASLLSLLGISQLAVLVNKMDAVGYREDSFRRLVEDYRPFLERLGLRATAFIPTAAVSGDNLAARSEAMPWYPGPTALEALDAFSVEAAPTEKPFRMPVQDVYKFTAQNDDRRIVVGTVASGTLRAGDRVVFHPSGRTSSVRSIEAFPGPSAASSRARAGDALGFTLTEQVYVRRGEVAARLGEPSPTTARRLRVSLFWLGREPLRQDREYVLKLGTARARVRLEEILYVLDASNLERTPGYDRVGRHEAAECVLHLDVPLACDLAEDNPRLGRFVLVDDFEISGGGLVREILQDPEKRTRDLVARRNSKWRQGLVDPKQREERLGQRSGLVLVTGSDEDSRRTVAKTLELSLFREGRFVYFLGIGSVLYGVDADLREGSGDHAEDIRRLAEVAHILLDSGLILVVTASRLRPDDLDLILSAVDPTRVVTVWIGAGPTASLPCDAEINGEPTDGCVGRIRELMRQKGLLGN